MTDLLTVRDVAVRYGTVPALSGLSFSVKEKQLVALLGANGAGKSTTLNTLAGLLKPYAGSIEFAGKDVAGKPTFQVVRRGLALVPEGRRVVATLTVAENLALSSYARGRSRSASLDDVWDLFPRLSERRHQLAGLLSGGEQQMLAIGRALMTKPSMLLLDEPSMGLSPALVDVVVGAIRQIHQSGVTMLLVEQNAAIALPLSDYAYLIHRGDIVTEGTAEALDRDPEMVARHLGLDPEIAAQEIDPAPSHGDA